MAKSTAKYLIQMRQFEELRQWRTPRGWTSRDHFSAWLTIFKSDSLEQAEECLRKQSLTGLRQWRIRFRNQTIKEL